MLNLSDRIIQKSVSQSFYLNNFNLGYLTAKHIRGFRLLCVLAYQILIGQYMTGGLIDFVVHYKAQKKPQFILGAVFRRCAGIDMALRMHV